MLLTAGAVDGSLQPLFDAVLAESPRASRRVEKFGFLSTSALSIVFVMLQAEFRTWVGADVCPPHPRVALFEGSDASRLPDDDDAWPITAWLDRIRDGFSWRFTWAFVSLQMPVVCLMRKRLTCVSGMLRRHLLSQLSQRLCALGATRAEERAIISELSVSPIEPSLAEGSLTESDPAAASAESAESNPKADERPPVESNRTINPVLLQLVLGTYDPHSPLSLFKGNRDVLEEIWLHVLDL